MQALVEEDVCVGLDVHPGGERPGRLAVGLGLLVVVQVAPGATGAGRSVASEKLLELVQQVGLWAEMAEVQVAGGVGGVGRQLHAFAVVPVKGVALDHGRSDVLTAEDVLQRPGHRRGPGS